MTMAKLINLEDDFKHYLNTIKMAKQEFNVHNIEGLDILFRISKSQSNRRKIFYMISELNS